LRAVAPQLVVLDEHVPGAGDDRDTLAAGVIAEDVKGVDHHLVVVVDTVVADDDAVARRRDADARGVAVDVIAVDEHVARVEDADAERAVIADLAVLNGDVGAVLDRDAAAALPIATATGNTQP